MKDGGRQVYKMEGEREEGERGRSGELEGECKEGKERDEVNRERKERDQ